jgi:ABC-type phosphate transport system auxiliary subunit
MKTHAGRRIIALMTAAAIDFASLCDELGALIDAPPARDEATRAQVERTLTDGYAQAMSLEGERLRLERRIGEVAAQVDVKRRGAKTEELQQLSERLARASADLKHLRALLTKVRRRVSAAA